VRSLNPMASPFANDSDEDSQGVHDDGTVDDSRAYSGWGSSEDYDSNDSMPPLTDFRRPGSGGDNNGAPSSSPAFNGSSGGVQRSGDDGNNNYDSDLPALVPFEGEVYHDYYNNTGNGDSGDENAEKDNNYSDNDGVDMSADGESSDDHSNTADDGNAEKDDNYSDDNDDGNGSADDYDDDDY